MSRPRLVYVPQVAGLYRGISPTLIGVAPYVGINFFVYETLKENAPVAPGASAPSALWLAACGAVAGALFPYCSFITFPHARTPLLWSHVLLAGLFLHLTR